MKRTIIFLILALIAGVAYAQSTATPILMGYLSTACSGSFNTCWVPYSVANPMPVSSN